MIGLTYPGKPTLIIILFFSRYYNNNIKRITERNIITRYTTFYHEKTVKGKTQQNFLNIDYWYAMTKEKGLIK